MRLLLGITGGIAAYRALELARLATRAGHGVRVLMTPTATRFVGAASFEAITGAPVLIDEFDPDPLRGAYPGEAVPEHDPISHLELAQRADVYLVAPASANTIAKLAAGMADGMVTTAFLASTARRALAPAMNDRMYRDEATQSNLRTLAARGVQIIEPDEGALASRGEHGIGRLAQPERLLAEAEALAGRTGPWEGLRVLISAGGTREPIDPVRFIGNRSSGRMGLALAQAARRMGAEVTLVAANVAIPGPAGVERIEVESAAELGDALGARFEACDILLMAAAVADFRPRDRHEGKLARESGEPAPIELDPNEDIVAGLASRRRPGQILVGFAAEHGGEFLERARAKLERKALDAIVVNDVSDTRIGFESAENEVTFITRDRTSPVARQAKDEVAGEICELTDQIRANRAAEV